jgi:glycosyltransferase involved in cell wall biosynthesis
MKISVYITSYNQKRYLIEAIESVLGQSLPPHQIIIADDGSTDGSQELIASYRNRYPRLVHVICHSVNLGVARTRIDALSAVTGDHVTYVDGDDRYLPEKLEKEARVLAANPAAQIAFSNNYYIDQQGYRTGVWASADSPPEGWVFPETFGRDFPKHNLFRMELIDYQAWKKVGFHDPHLALYEDFDMRIRLTKYYRTVYCPEPLTEYRLHGSGLSSVAASRHLAALEYIYQKNKRFLADLRLSERKEIQRKLGQWMARIAKQAARETRHRQRIIPLKYFLKSVSYQGGWLDLGQILDF